MKILVDRKWKKETYTIGRLYINDVFFCNTLEDRDRGLNQTHHIDFIKSRKVYAETAIPTGTYDVAMNITSPKYAAVAWYYKLCQGKMPRLRNVTGFEGILVHPGSTALDSAGCILVGKNTKVGMLTESKATFEKLYKKMKAAYDKGETITIQII